MKEIDARGLACPQPVILVRKALAESGKEKIEVRLDSVSARDNVIRTTAQAGYHAEITEDNDEIRIIIGPK